MASRLRALLFAMSSLAAVAASAQYVIGELPPQLLPMFQDIPLDGGRTQAITVHPRDPNRIVIACALGGLWKTADNTANWSHLDGLNTVFARDVVYSPDGSTLVATIARDNQVTNGGGIYVSRDDGITWTRPPTSIPPASSRIPARTGAWGVSFAPDIAGRIYAGTDYGVATSSDNGVTWTHTALDPTGPLDFNKLQDAAFSLLALPGDRAIAASRRGLFIKAPGGSTWTNVRARNFAFGDGFKLLDVSPLDSDKVLIVQDWSNCLLFEVASGTFTTLPVPPPDPNRAGGRGQFVRASRSTVSGAIDLWFGGSYRLWKATRRTLAELRATAATDWQEIGRPQGLHDDTGYLGLDGNSRPALYGCDGGVFRPTNPQATMWERAAFAAGHMNSYQIADLTATTTFVSSTSRDRTTALYFATQDNALWASTDGGITWPNNDCAEGYYMRAAASSPLPADVTVGYATVGCSGNRLSDVALTNQRNVPNLDTSGATVSSLESAFFVAPRKWVRVRRPTSVPEFWVSEDNGSTWRKRADVTLQFMGVFTPSMAVTAGATPVIYIPVRGEQTTADGRPRDGLIRLDDAFGSGIRHFTEADVIYLPNDGSLGTRATDWDWHSVFAVDPRDPNFIIAPDIINSVIRVSSTGGASWSDDTALTNLVTERGRLLMYDDEGHMQVTHIEFDPFNSSRVLVGTRDAGIMVSGQRAGSWRKILFSERALYVTGFAFRSSAWPVYASTYGRGLWRISLFVLNQPFHFDLCALIRCQLWPLHFDTVSTPTVPPTIYWSQHGVASFTGGHVNGIVLSGGAVKSVSVTPGTDLRQYNPIDKQAPEFSVVESDKGFGFAGLEGPLAATEKKAIVNAIVFEAGKPVAIIAGDADLPKPKEEGETAVSAAVKSERPTPSKRPYLILSTDGPSTGYVILAPNNILHVSARGFSGANTPRILIDGRDVDARPKVADDGRFVGDVKVASQLLFGTHRIEVVQGSLRAAATFVKAPFDDFGKKR
jgi:hypothetical protein